MEKIPQLSNFEKAVVFFLCWYCLKNLILLMKVRLRLCYEL